jgi:acyl-CoA synthetase (AMP-forming)/AMP-acid ligase II
MVIFKPFRVMAHAAHLCCPKSLLPASPHLPASDSCWRCMLAALRHVTSSGEPVTWDLAEGILRRLPGAQLLNVYGSSEVGADTTACDVGDLWRQRRQVAPEARLDSHSWGRKQLAGSPDCVPVGAPLPGTLVAVARLQFTSISISENPVHSKAAQLAGDSTSGNSAAAGVHDGDAGSVLHLADPGEEGEVWVAGPGVTAGRFPRSIPRLHLYDFHNIFMPH